MKITTILCTYNRCQSLTKALDSLALSILPETTEWDVLVVDNNSNDQTRAVVEDFHRRYLGRFHYLFEAHPGKSYALNAGIREARGEILAFLDDDVVVEPNWLQDLTSGLDDGDWAGSGGRILPMRGFVPPRWLALEGPYNLAGALCAFCDPGDVPGELKEPPYGANMAFRKEMFERFGDFRTDLGPRPGSEMRSEDTEFGRRLMAQGERLRYVPSAVVYHEVHASRVQKGFFLAWWFDFGRGAIRETGKRLSFKELLRTVARTLLATPRWLLTLGSQARFYRKCRIWYDVGKIVEVCRLTKPASAPRTQHEALSGPRA
jgi:glycosyltransferase involved in cell wall biosynthesis